MSDDFDLVVAFANALASEEMDSLRAMCSNRLQFFNQLFGYLKSEQIYLYWELQKKNGVRLTESDRPEDLGDGYYKLSGKLRFVTINNVTNAIPVYLHIRIENEKITEYSEAFSLHKMAQIQSPFWGWLLGWNRYYQNRMKIKARKDLYNQMNA